MNRAPKQSWWIRFSRWLRLQALHVIRENSTPARTGLGFALGAFIGIFPSFLLGTPLAFFLAGQFQWNRAAAVTGTFLMNPLTAPLLYSTSTWLGLELLGRSGDGNQAFGLLDNLRHFGTAFLLGNTLVATLVAALLGLAVFGLVQRRSRLVQAETFLDETAARLSPGPLLRTDEAAQAAVPLLQSIPGSQDNVPSEALPDGVTDAPTPLASEACSTASRLPAS